MTDLAGPQVLDDVSKPLASISCRLWLFYIDCKFYMAFRNWAVLMLKCNMTSRKVRMVFALYWEKPRKAKGASWQAFLRFLVLVYNFGLTVEKRTNVSKLECLMGPYLNPGRAIQNITRNVNAILGFLPTSTWIVALKWRNLFTENILEYCVRDLSLGWEGGDGLHFWRPPVKWNWSNA